MHPRTLATIIVIVIAVGLIGWLLIDTSPAAAPADARTVTVGASIFPLADMVQIIGGDLVTAITVLPAGASPHTFELTPATIQSLADAQLVLKIGHGLDDWIDGIGTSLPQATIDTVDQGVVLRPNDDADADSAFDPHYWLSIANAKIIARNIAEALRTIDPEHGDVYTANLEAYLPQLDTLIADVRETLAPVTNRSLITFHASWGYFAEEFDLDVVGVFEVSPGAEPTPQLITELQDLVSQYQVPALFSEPQLSDQVIRPFAEDVNIPIDTLDPIGGIGDRQSYIDLMHYNAQTIAQALTL